MKSGRKFRDSKVFCISISFWVLHAPKYWSKHLFSAVFKLSCSFLNVFSEFAPENVEKRLKMKKKK